MSAALDAASDLRERAKKLRLAIAKITLAYGEGSTAWAECSDEAIAAEFAAIRAEAESAPSWDDAVKALYSDGRHSFVQAVYWLASVKPQREG